MDLNLHSVFKVAENDIEGKVAPIIEKFLTDLETGLKDLGFSHVSSNLTSDSGVKALAPAAKPAAPAAPVASVAPVSSNTYTSIVGGDEPTKDAPPQPHSTLDDLK